jgi:hypothetical protein
MHGGIHVCAPPTICGVSLIMQSQFEQGVPFVTQRPKFTFWPGIVWARLRHFQNICSGMCVVYVCACVHVRI